MANEKTKVGDTKGIYTLLERLGNGRVKVRCSVNGQIHEMTYVNFWNEPKYCRTCQSSSHNKLPDGHKIDGTFWKIVNRNTDGRINIVCEKCNETYIHRHVPLSRGCRKCFPSSPATGDAKARQIAPILIRNARKRQEVKNRLIGTTINWMRIVDVIGDKVLCECIGEGPHPDGNLFTKYRQDVELGFTTSCGCQRIKKLNQTLLDSGLLIDHTGKRFGYLVAKIKQKDHYLCLCDCGKEKEIFIGNLLNGDIRSCGCTTHAMRVETMLRLYGRKYAIRVTMSKGELELGQFIESLGLAIERQIPLEVNFKKTQARTKELDIIVPSKNIAFEYNGEFWHSEWGESPKFADYHIGKTEASRNKGIRLIHIMEHYWLNRREQVKSFIRSALGKNTTTVGARELTIKICTFEDIAPLLESTHIQGATQGKWYIGCYFKHLLVAAAVIRRNTFNPTIRNLGGWELARWVVGEGISTPGALDKVSNFASKLIQSDIVTMSDRMLTEGGGYLAAGWEKHCVGEPTYFYFDRKSGGRFISKYQRRKSVVETPDEQTEFEHAKNDKLLKIWDCGKNTFVYRFRK
jgi:hypothetical protein